MSVQDGMNGTLVELRPTQYLEPKEVGSDGAAGQAALIILNSPLTNIEYFTRLYYHASFRLCADGGANQLHDLILRESPGLGWAEALRRYQPDTIHGDLDSLDPNVRKQYEQLGVEISQDPDQYSTDFGKGIKKVIERLPDVRDILVLGSLGGRVDQGIGLLHELYREQVHRHPNIRFWLFSESSVTTLLRPGTIVLHTPVAEGLITRNIGILPLYGPAIINTEGLEWDVQDWPTEMGAQVSTSNHIVQDRITITTDKDVLFTVERARIG
ncbi:hypothetical protein LTR36_007381 [Oleoguttula mirabilis]|uniref:Thiamine pyrophosphokinase n=1 Tax=Oleoguttula mirabilis TaxID=1507867 RepID=A0AAV9JA71_9PEZI|nr:hypothetical protein LTR36_007381 [Oleoguttula mirabilis]